jgi:hypothetical protein
MDDDRPMVVGGDWSALTGGDGSIVIGGGYSTIVGGDYSTVIGGAYSTLTGGDESSVKGNYKSVVAGGEGSTLLVDWHDGIRHRTAVAYVGENGIEANVFYHVDDGGKFVKHESTATVDVIDTTGASK